MAGRGARGRPSPKQALPGPLGRLQRPLQIAHAVVVRLDRGVGLVGGLSRGALQFVVKQSEVVNQRDQKVAELRCVLVVRT